MQADQFRKLLRSGPMKSEIARMKVQQELMRHASIQMTMNVYGRAMAETKRRVDSQVVGLVFGPNSQEPEAVDSAATAL